MCAHLLKVTSSFIQGAKPRTCFNVLIMIKYCAAQPINITDMNYTMVCFCLVFFEIGTECNKCSTSHLTPQSLENKTINCKKSVALNH